MFSALSISAHSLKTKAKTQQTGNDYFSDYTELCLCTFMCGLTCGLLFRQEFELSERRIKLL